MTKLQQELIDLISETQDALILNEVKKILDMGAKDEEIYIMSSEQEAAIEEAELETEAGEFIDNETANQQIRQWLNGL